MAGLTAAADTAGSAAAAPTADKIVKQIDAKATLATRFVHTEHLIAGSPEVVVCRGLAREAPVLAYPPKC